MIVPGGALNSIFLNKMKYIIQLNLNIKLIRKGNITFYYQKDTVIENNECSGVLKFFINYVEIYSDNGLTDINEINYKDNFDNIKWKNILMH